MKHHWQDSALGTAVILSAVALMRSIIILETPAARDLPKALRSIDLNLSGQAMGKMPVGQSKVGRDVSWGPRHYYQTNKPEIELELVARRSRSWDGLPPPALTNQDLLQLDAHQQVALGQLNGKQALRSCLVAQDAGKHDITAAVVEDNLSRATMQRREQLKTTYNRGQRLWRKLMIQLGLQNERWECLQVTVKVKLAENEEQSRTQLVATWKELYPQLKSWAKQTEEAQE